MNIFIISLDSAKERQQFQRQQLTKLNLDFEFLNAISTNDIDINTYKKHYYDWQRPLHKTEVACYFSHQLAWHKIINSNQPALILEDDALLSNCVPKLLSSLSTEENIDLINLENRGRKKFVAKKGKNIACNSKLLKLYQDRTGAAGYILWPSGAKKLIKCEQKMGIALADAHITRCYQLKSYQIEPSPIIQLDHCNYYQIQNNLSKKLSSSSVSSNSNPSGGPLFILKKIKNQLHLGIRQLLILPFCSRRYIDISTKDFQKNS